MYLLEGNSLSCSFEIKYITFIMHILTFICPLHFPEKSVILNQPCMFGKPERRTVKSTAAKPSTVSACIFEVVTVLFDFRHNLNINFFCDYGKVNVKKKRFFFKFTYILQ